MGSASRASHPAGSRHRSTGGTSTVVVELVRLSVVVLATALAYEVAGQMPAVARAQERGRDALPLLVIALGAGVGYLGGGWLGRFAVGRIDAVERSLREISAGELVAGFLGAFAGLLLGLAVVWPLLLFEGKVFTVPLAALVVVLLAATGLRVGVARGGDLLRFVGATGRLPVASPASGSRAKVVDTSTLVDGRIVDVAGTGFLEGNLVVPRFVLYELQGLADAGDEERRARGRRGLDVLAALQRSGQLALEVADRDYPDIGEVDAKLVMLARERKAALVTVDGNLARIAEVQGVKVLSLHHLADTLRPPVLPGEVLDVRVVKPGKEAGQGVGYLADGTMVVVEGGRDVRGSFVSAEVTSILNNANGRMVFATLRPSGPRLLSRRATVE